MLIQDALVIVLVGLFAGWLASFVVGGSSRLGYLVSGIVGAFVGPFVVNWAEQQFGFAFFVVNPAVTEILIAAIGAIVVVFIRRLVLGR